MALMSPMTHTNPPCQLLTELSVTWNRVGRNSVAGLIPMSEVRGPVLIEGHPRIKAATHLNWSSNSQATTYIPSRLPDVLKAHMGTLSPTVIDICLGFLRLQQ